MRIVYEYKRELRNRITQSSGSLNSKRASQLKMMFKLVFVLLLASSCLVDAFKKTAECDVRKVSKNCIKTGFLFGENKGFPKTTKQMEQFCDNVKKGEECAKKFKNSCAENEREREVIDSGLSGAVRVMRRVCNTDRKKQIFLRNVKDCGNAIFQESREKCGKTYKNHLLAASKLSNKDDILKLMCCKVKDIKDCIQKIMDKKDECDEDNKEYINSLQENIGEELTSIVCVDFEKDIESKCSNLKIPKYSGPTDKESMIDALKKIVEKLKQ